MRLAVVVPTRNRGLLALEAARSALSGPADVVVLSDNSSDGTEADALANACASVDRLAYVRPGRPMPMTDHWNWALERVLADEPDVTHVAYLGDRWLYRPGALSDIAAVVRDHPEFVVSYTWDTVDDFRKPVRLRLTPWSGRVVTIHSTQFLRRAAVADVWHNSLPRMLNSVAPVETLDAIRSRFGSVFGSIAPDFCFAYRCLSVVDEIVYYDRPCMIDHSLNRSTGTNFHRSGSSKDLADFLEFSGGGRVSPLAPIPDVSVAWNIAVHEYCAARAESASEKFPPLDHDAYLRQVSGWVADIPDDDERAANVERLRRAGWTGEIGNTGPVREPRGLSALLYRAACHPVTMPVWLLAARLGFDPPGAQRFWFRSTRSALAYALRHPRKPRPSLQHVGPLVDAPVAPR